MMENFIYNLAPVFSAGLVAISFLLKLYKRSVSTFTIILTTAIVVNLNRIGEFYCSTIILLLTLVFLLYRAMTKPEAEHLFYSSYHGEERRGRR